MQLLTVYERKNKTFDGGSENEPSNNDNETYVLRLPFQYKRNLYLTKVSVLELSYLRQITVCVLCITNIKQNKNTVYVFHDSKSRKSPDEV